MMLMEQAERIAREEHGAYKISVISGVFSCPFLIDCSLERGYVHMSCMNTSCRCGDKKLL